jgi:peroxiredoxin
VSELQGLQLRKTEFDERRCAVVGVSADQVEASAQLARDAALAFPLLADPTLGTTDAYGLRYRAGGPNGQDIATSASVLIDGHGIVRWTVVGDNFRVRPTPARVLAAVDGLR